MTTEEMKDLSNILVEDVLYEYSILFNKYYLLLDDDLVFYICESCQGETGSHFKRVRKSDGMNIANYYWCQDCLYIHLLIAIILYE